MEITSILGEHSQKIRDYLVIFPKRGGSPQSQIPIWGGDVEVELVAGKLQIQNTKTNTNRDTYTNTNKNEIQMGKTPKKWKMRKIEIL